MHLALVTHNVLIGDGQGRVNYELTRYLLNHGIDVTLIADKIAPELIDAGASWMPVHPKPFADQVDLFKVWRFREMADRLLHRVGSQFDLVMGCGVTLSCPHHLNAVHFVHGTWLDSPYHASTVRSGLDSWYQQAFSSLNAGWEIETFRQAQRVVAVSEMVRDELLSIGVAPSKIEVVVNGVDCTEFHPGSADRTALDLPDNVLLGLFVGDIQSPIKNLDLVLEALVDAPDIHLAVAGHPDGSPYPRLADRLGIASRVHFLGFRRDVADLMRGADFFSLPSRRDSCPLVLLEALASGLPVITARTVGTSNLVNSHPLIETEAGFVLDNPDDRSTMDAALHTFANDPDRRIEMGRTARRIAEHHSWHQMAASYLSIFDNVLQPV